MQPYTEPLFADLAVPPPKCPPAQDVHGDRGNSGDSGDSGDSGEKDAHLAIAQRLAAELAEQHARHKFLHQTRCTTRTRRSVAGRSVAGRSVAERSVAELKIGNAICEHLLAALHA